MSRRDLFHDAVRHALEKAGWTITHDPLPLTYGETKVYVDLGADPPIGAELNGRKIAVEIKTFIGLSGMQDLYNAVGQFVVYRTALEIKEPERELFLAVPVAAYSEFFEIFEGQTLIKSAKLKILVYHAKKEEITQWIN